ncbi:MAG: biotin synthase BioB [Desulfovibrio sp.]|jgi:biotin synthase|nr:biotin synthase BioB [Desulfovibrio sp.]
MRQALDLQETQEKASAGALSREEAAAVLALPDERLPELLDAAYALRLAHKGRLVDIQILTNAKSGGCGQDCAYCAQGKDSRTGIATYALAGPETFLDNARLGQETGVSRHCIALSGLYFDDAGIAAFCRRVEQIRQEADTPICCSIGFLTRPQAERLKKAGVDRINHNLNTGRNFYPRICSTHSYDERVRNIRMLKDTGFEICSGGIAGLGEEREDLADMFLALQDLSPKSVPVNFFLPVPGTPLAARDLRELTPEYCLKVLCLARFILPGADLRCAAGREVYLKDVHPQLFRVADSIFASGYLTVGGDSLQETIRQIREAGFLYRLAQPAGSGGPKNRKKDTAAGNRA